MIRETLLPELKRRFSADTFREGDDDRTVTIFPAKHPAVGDVTIWDDGDEATVLIANITHGHFNPYDESLSESERDRIVTEDVISFLSDLFADKVLLWVSKRGRSGGWQLLQGSEPQDYMEKKRRYFLWSGPIRKQGWPTMPFSLPRKRGG